MTITFDALLIILHSQHSTLEKNMRAIKLFIIATFITTNVNAFAGIQLPLFENKWGGVTRTSKLDCVVATKKGCDKFEFVMEVKNSSGDTSTLKTYIIKNLFFQ